MTNSRLVNLVYSAALFDAEGTIVIAHDKINNKFRLRADISNTSINVLRQVKDLFGGGRIYPRKHDWRLPRPYYVLSFSDIQAASFLTAVLPFLRNQRKQAIRGIKLQAHKTKAQRDALEQSEINAQHRRIVHV